MKDKSVEKIIQIAGDKNYYQYFILFCAFGFWITLNLFNVSLPYLEKMPIVKYKLSNGTNITTILNYKICETKNYTIFERSGHSWVAEYVIYCDRVKTGLLGTISSLGGLIASILFSILSENTGRKLTIELSGILYSVILLISLFIRNIYQIYIFCFCLSIFLNIGLMCSLQMTYEVITPHLRSQFGALICSGYSMSGLIYIGIIFFSDSWRLCFIIGNIFNLFVLILFYFGALESPRYFLKNKEINKFIENLKDMSIKNGFYDRYDKMVLSEYKKELILETLTTVETSANDITNNDNKNETNIDEKEILIPNYGENLADEEEIKNILKELKLISIKSQQNEKKTHGFSSLFTYESQRYKFLILCLIWFSVCGTYNGIYINLKNQPTNIYLSGIVYYIIDIVASFLSGYLISFKVLGRINSVIGLYLIFLGALFSLILFEIPYYMHAVFENFARFSISAIYSILYTYTVESYPTPIRSIGFGMNCISGSLGNMIFPLLIELLSEHVNYVFALLNLVCLILVFFLPETLCKPLGDSIPEDNINN